MDRKWVVGILVWRRMENTVKGEMQITRRVRITAKDAVQANRSATRWFGTVYPKEQQIRVVLVREAVSSDEEEGPDRILPD